MLNVQDVQCLIDEHDQEWGLKDAEESCCPRLPAWSGGDISHDFDAQIFITTVAAYRTAYGRIPVSQHRAVGTERLNMATFQKNVTGTV